MLAEGTDSLSCRLEIWLCLAGEGHTLAWMPRNSVHTLFLSPWNIWNIELLLTIFLKPPVASISLKEVQLEVGALSSLLSAKGGFQVGMVQRRGSWWPDASWGRLQNPHERL